MKLLAGVQERARDMKFQNLPQETLRKAADCIKAVVAKYKEDLDSVEKSIKDWRRELCALAPSPAAN